ncbi:hypothetical protein [Roseospira goensis]|uniref:Uncharacterized protein n=1 Tax=Roseospira goensis TaxID=391922 RepID=A0A7W6S291_9PROT|nr:hypothetical protein [Roseospira goensis]MBB4287509.1 hypothetical protein [Roseospira goensis]
MALADMLARRRAERERDDTDALAADLKARADHVYAIMAYIATHGHDDGTDEPCVEWEPPA